MHIEDVISEDLGVPESMIKQAIELSRNRVKIFKIKKRNGGDRVIYHPSNKLKTIQYWLIRSIFEKLPVHESAMAYRDGISILHNAKAHKDNRFFLKMDFKDFFPSIRFDDLLPLIEKWHKKEKPEWDMDAYFKELLRKVCFYKGDKLAIGYPSSPIISNIVMLEFDSNVTKIVADDKFGKVIYTRYADDLVFSTNKKGACNLLMKEIEGLVLETKSPNIFINAEKTRYGSSTGGKASVTGLKIGKNGHITIHRKQKDHIRLMLSLYAKGQLRENEYSSLLGHLSYCHYVCPQFYSRIAKKYFKEIYELQARN